MVVEKVHSWAALLVFQLVAQKELTTAAEMVESTAGPWAALMALKKVARRELMSVA